MLRILSLASPTGLRRTVTLGLGVLLGFAFPIVRAGAPATTLADQPIFAGADVPGNLALALSVEYPTATSVANLGNYVDSSTSYLGYFDPLKCYTYSYNSSTPSKSYFQPASLAGGTYNHTCSGQWSGNFMNWATMQTIDPFRWALTGGFRRDDNPNQTILEKAWASGQGGTSNYPDRGTGYPGVAATRTTAAVPAITIGSGNLLVTSQVPVSAVTPFSTWSYFNFRMEGNGDRMVFSSTSATYTNTTGTDLNTSTPDAATAYQVYIRVSVCDATHVLNSGGASIGAAGLESNCVQYGSNYKPEGLLQQYSNQIRYSAFSYLNGSGATRQGGVLREPMGFIGPTYPQPLSTAVTTNTRPEWDASTGIMIQNPDTALAGTATGAQSGVMNYLNKFGETNVNTYMTNDNVSELYYAVIRYFENLGNVPEWTNSASSTELDGFPAATTWTDPILYICQKNFILGIGDDHTHVDYNVGTGTVPRGVTVASGSRTKPSAVGSDTLNQAASWTASLQTLEGITQTPWWTSPYVGTGNQATYYIAGLAYGAHVTNIRPDLAGTSTANTAATAIPTPVTVSTYWMDVAEYQVLDTLNPYYLATKYGGFSVPSGYTIPTALNKSWWDTTGSTVLMTDNQSHDQPDNYFVAGNANAMVTGLRSAFSNIANAVKAYTTSLSLSTAVASSAGTTSFATQYDPSGWTGIITGSTLTLAADGTPTTTSLWVTSSTLQTQLAGSGWNTGRNIATWNGTGGVAFRAANLSAQNSALQPGYSPSTTVNQYVNYLRGDQTNEVGSTATGSTQSLRARKLLLGDIVDAKLTPVGAPSMSFTEANNPGYAGFKSSYASRPTVVYAGANDGMLHAFLGTSGTEQFAYVPSALYQGPNGTPQVDGLAQLGNPHYVHHYYVDATPVAFDVDFGTAGGTFTTTTAGNAKWHTLLIGGLGKGGKSFYAIDVTNPAAMTTESAVAGAVKWEFSDSTMGYSFGAPIMVKTAKYGWVVALTSGYNNSDGYGYLYLLNPSSGVLLEKIATPSPSSGLTQAAGYVRDYTDYTADSIYAGDLNGQIWRFDLRAARGSTAPYPAPTLLATLKDGSGNAQPVTTAPLIEIHPTTRKRTVMVGTGQLLSALDVTSNAVQSFYAILDGTAGGFNTVATPITRSNLTPVADLTVGVTLSSNSQGWYTDLGTSSGTAWRMVVNPIAYNGIVGFTTLLPTGNACSASGQSQVYALNYGTAKTALSTGLAYFSPPNAVIDLKFFKNSDTSTTQLIAGDSTGAPSKIPANLTGVFATRLLNWREVPTPD